MRGSFFYHVIIFPIGFRLAKITYNLAFLSAIGLNNFLQIDLLVPEKKIFKDFFTLYGHSGHLDHVTINLCYKFTPLNLRTLHIKFEFNWPSGF